MTVPATLKVFIYTEYCESGPYSDRTCRYVGLDSSLICVSATLNCSMSKCEAAIYNYSRYCRFVGYTGVMTTKCCFCKNTNFGTAGQWWSCSNVSSSILISSSSGEYYKYNYVITPLRVL